MGTSRLPTVIKTDKAAGRGEEMANEGLSRALAFIENASQVREAHYRDKAARLRELAETEPLPRYRKKLFELADEFDALADTARHPLPDAKSRQLPAPR